MARLVAEYRIHHLIEGLPGVNGNRPECAQAILISRQEAAYVLARVPGPAPLVVSTVAIADFPAPALPVINTALIGAYHRQILKAAQRVGSPTPAMDGLTTGAGTQRIFTCLR